METEILIIGGGIAGTTAAETFRAGNAGARIAIVSEEKHPLYSRVLLPHAVTGRIPDTKVYLKKESSYKDADIDYLAGVRITDVDPAEKTARFDDGSRVRFGKLVIATGTRPKPWNVPGTDLEGVLRLQRYEDIAAVRARLASKGEMVIVGTGFIAMEFIAFALHAGIRTTVLNRGPYFRSSVFSEALGREVHGILESKGITVFDNARVKGVSGVESVEGVLLEDGREISCHALGLGIGLDIDTEPFRNVGTDSGILTDATLKTAHDDIWAAGDCCEFEDALLGFRRVVGNWTNAIAQGRHVARAMLGEEKPYRELTAHTLMSVPEASLIYLGETRLRDGIEKESKIFGTGKAVQIHRNGGRIVGAVLLNAPQYRVACVKAIMDRSDASLADVLK